MKAKDSSRKKGRKILVWDGSDDCEFTWDDLIWQLGEVLRKKNPDGYWFAEVSNFGWQSMNGSKFFYAEKGEDLLHELLPKTDCHFNIYNFGNGIAIQNYHHDSPVGNEWYYVVPCAGSTFEKLGGR